MLDVDKGTKQKKGRTKSNAFASCFQVLHGKTWFKVFNMMCSPKHPSTATTEAPKHQPPQPQSIQPPSQLSEATLAEKCIALGGIRPPLQNCAWNQLVLKPLSLKRVANHLFRDTLGQNVIEHPHHGNSAKSTVNKTRGSNNQIGRFFGNQIGRFCFLSFSCFPFF